MGAIDGALIDGRLAPQELANCVEQMRRDCPVDMPILVLAEQVSAPGVVAALAAGADDVVRIPVDHAELSLRVASVRRKLALIETLRAETRTDALTGLHSRRSLVERLGADVSLARRSGQLLSIAAIDIDAFKAINDQQGHPVGDSILLQFGQLVAEMIRQGDTVGRVGGDEFIWVLPQADLDQARRAAERLKLQVAAQMSPVTVSIGVTTWQSDEDATSLIARADKMLYMAKCSGRDTVYCEPDPSLIDIATQA